MKGIFDTKKLMYNKGYCESSLEEAHRIGNILTSDRWLVFRTCKKLNKLNLNQPNFKNGLRIKYLKRWNKNDWEIFFKMFKPPKKYKRKLLWDFILPQSQRLGEEKTDKKCWHATLIHCWWEFKLLCHYGIQCGSSS